MKMTMWCESCSEVFVSSAMFIRLPIADEPHVCENVKTYVCRGCYERSKNPRRHSEWCTHRRRPEQQFPKERKHW